MNRTNRRGLLGIAVAALLAIGVGTSGAAERQTAAILFERQAGTAGSADVFAVQPDGTGLRRLTTDSSSSDPAWSPDRRRIAFVSGRGGAFWAPDLYVMNANGRNVRRLTRSGATRTTYLASSEPAWTADGRRIVFVRTAVRRGRAQSDLWIVQANGRGLRRLTATPGHESSPSLSPFGLLAFSRSSPTGVPEVLVKLLDEPNARRIARGASVAWSPEGHTVAFEWQGSVYTVRSDGTQLRRVTAGGAPSWSPDGARIVVTTPAGLVSVLADGGDSRVVTRRPETAYDGDASWSSPRTQPPRGFAIAPADRGIVYAAGSGRNAELYVRDASGAVRRLTTNRVYDGFPAWSPDRRRIAFVSTRGDGTADVYVMRADGTNVRRVTRGRGHDVYPAWSPDGERIVFASDRRSVEQKIYVVRADGTGLRLLTRTPGYVQDTLPRFSPDGRHVVFTSNRVAYWNFELFRMRASDGGGVRRLTFWGSGGDGAPGDDIAPSYSPDGRRIVFVSDRGGGYALWTMNADGGGLRELVRHRGLNHASPRFSPDGKRVVYMTFAPENDGSDAELRVVGADGTGDVALRPGREPDW
jgi:Tol biopolymer transport system component